MWWKHVVEFIIALAIVYSTVALFFGFIKIKTDDKKERGDRTEDSV